jgi:hypothetical protein
LFKQSHKASRHWLILKLAGTRANRSAIGARVKVVTGAHVQSGEVRSGGSYLSQNDLRLHFGLGAAAMVDRIEVTWPGGGHQVLEHVAADRVLEITETR